MSQHPITPMDEADLRVHLSKQTNKTIGLLDATQLDAATSLDGLDGDILLIDMLYESQLEKVGRLIDERSRGQSPLFLVGSSGVESCLAAHWKHVPAKFEPARHAGPIIAICGSCSPVTVQQIRWAAANGFDEFTIGQATVRSAIQSICAGKSVVIHTNAADAVELSAPRFWKHPRPDAS